MKLPFKLRVPLYLVRTVDPVQRNYLKVLFLYGPARMVLNPTRTTYGSVRMVPNERTNDRTHTCCFTHMIVLVPVVSKTVVVLPTRVRSTYG